MQNGISGAPLPIHLNLRYADPIQKASEEKNFFPCLTYAIAFRETIAGEMNGEWNAATVVSGDGGHGLFQLTYPFAQPWPPENWEDPLVNTTLALDHYLIPAYEYFVGHGISGDSLVLCIAAGFNSGDQTAWSNHLLGSVDLGTTDNYAADILKNYHRLLSGQHPTE